MADVSQIDLKDLKTAITGDLAGLGDKFLNAIKGARDEAKKENKDVISQFGDRMASGMFKSARGTSADRKQFLKTIRVNLVDISEIAFRKLKGIIPEDADGGVKEEEDDKPSWMVKLLKWVKMLGSLGLLVLGIIGGGGIIGGLFTDSAVTGFMQLLGRQGSLGFFKLLATKIPEFFGKILAGTLDDLLVAGTRMIGAFAPKTADIISKMFVAAKPALGALRIIPLIGTLISWAFAISDFSKGDFIGGAINFTAGVVGLVPVIGPWLAVGLGVLNAILDWKMGRDEKKALGKKMPSIMAVIVKAGLQIGKVIGKGLKWIPVIGSLFDLGSAYIRLKQGDFVGGMIDIAAGIAGFIPGFGPFLSIGISLINSFLDTKAGSGVKKFFGESGTGLLKVIISYGLKWAAKIAKPLLTGLKFIPVIGGLFSLGFAIWRFKKGQYVRGVLELVSGIADIVGPATLGIGNVISMVIDGLLLIVDLVEPKGGYPTFGAAMGKVYDFGKALFKWVAGFVWKSPWLFPYRMLWEGFQGLKSGAPIGETLGKMAYTVPLLGKIAGLLGGPGTYEEYAEAGGDKVSADDIDSALGGLVLQLPLVRQLFYGAKGLKEIFAGNWKEGLLNLSFMFPGAKLVYDLIKGGTEGAQGLAAKHGISGTQAIAVGMGRKVIGWVPYGFKTIVAKGMAMMMGVDHNLLLNEDDEDSVTSDSDAYAGVGAKIDRDINNVIQDGINNASTALGHSTKSLSDANRQWVGQNAIAVDRIRQGSLDIRMGGEAIGDVAENIRKEGEEFTKGSPFADEVLRGAGIAISNRVDGLVDSSNIYTQSLFTSVANGFNRMGERANKALESDIKSRAPRSNLISLAQEQLEIQREISLNVKRLTERLIEDSSRAQFDPVEVKEKESPIDENRERARQYQFTIEKKEEEKKEEKGFIAAMGKVFKKFGDLLPGKESSQLGKMKLDIPTSIFKPMVTAQQATTDALTNKEAPVVKALTDISNKIDGINPVNRTTVISPGGSKTSNLRKESPAKNVRKLQTNQ